MSHLSNIRFTPSLAAILIGKCDAAYACVAVYKSVWGKWPIRVCNIDGTHLTGMNGQNYRKHPKASWFESWLIWGKAPPLHCYLKFCGSETMSYMHTGLAENGRGILLKKIKNWKGGEILLLYQELCSQVEINTHLLQVKLRRSVLCVNACSSPAVLPPQGRRPDNTN